MSINQVRPLISVIIPTFNRAELLRASLKSLTKQSLSRRRFEVIIIDDGSTDETRDVSDKFKADLDLKYAYQANSGISSAKNLGIFISRAPILLFFDDDDIADRELLAEHLGTHEKHPQEHIAVLGYTTWAKTLAITTIMRYVTDIGHFLFSYTDLKQDQGLDFTYFWGGRSSCKRSFLTNHGIFNQQFRFGSEDIELGFRLSQFGLKVIYNRNAISYMNRSITYEEFCRRCEKQGRSQYHFSRIHSEPVIQQYCMVADAEDKWRHLENMIDRKTARAREIESLVVSGALGNAAQDLLSELNDLYWWTFTAYKFKGIVEEKHLVEQQDKPTTGLDKLTEQPPRKDLDYVTKKWAMIPAAPRTRGNILVIDPFLPMFDRAAGSLRLLHILKSLRMMRYQVTFIARDAAYADQYLPVLQDLGIETYVGDLMALEAAGMNRIGNYLDMEKILRKRPYDIVILDFWHLAEYYLPLVRRHSPASRIIIDTIDIHFLRELREAELKQSAELKHQAERIKQRELNIYERADMLWVVTIEEKKAIERSVPGIPIDIVPTIHETISVVKQYDKTADLLFVGNFNHTPNGDAVLYFCKEIFPLIIRKLKSVTLSIVGNNPPPEITSLASDRIKVTGYVQDLSPYLSNARISINPLRYGAGMKGKIGEALAWGLPVITTTIGAEGMGLVDGQNALIADTPEEFAAKTIRLYHDRDLWQRLSTNGWNIVRHQWSPATVRNRLEAILSSVAIKPAVTSIIILTFNELKYTKECVESIRNNTPEAYEIIFVDNGSTDGTVKWLRELVNKYPDYRLIENRTNLGFARGCNQGIEAAAGKYVLLLNNDVVVTKDWLSGMLECLNSAQDTGIVGPMTNNISGPQKVERIGYSSTGRLADYANIFTGQYRHRRIPLRRIVGFCMLFRRSLIDTVGLFDESFGSGNFEDDDFCYRAALAGYRNVVSGDVFIHHYGSRSFIGNSIDYKTSLSGNRKLFDDKWSRIDASSPLGGKMLTLNARERADVFRQQGLIDDAIKVLVDRIGFSPNENNVYYQLADILIDEKRFQDAFDALNEIPDAHGESRYFEALGYCNEGLGRYPEAEEYADRALSSNETSAAALNLKGILEYKKGGLEKAAAFFNKALTADSGYGEPYTNLGMLSWASERREEALNLLEKGFILSPDRCDIITAYHTAISGLGFFERAEPLFRDARAAYPGNKRILFLLIDIFLKQDKFSEAMEEVEKEMVRSGTNEGILAAALEIRKRIGPITLTTSTSKKAKASLSVCMIVKNEEQHLARCLDSLIPVADEIIVVDTGSIDRTRDIATAFGAQVFDFEWINDFSAARNYSLSKAGGHWILVMDADEVISPQDHAQLRGLIKHSAKRTVAYSFITRNYVDTTDADGWTSNDNTYPYEQAGRGWFPSDKVRLFPNHKSIAFVNPVHELVEPALLKMGITIEKSGVPVHHYGEFDLQKGKLKDEEYYQLGMKKLKECGGDFKAVYELAVQAGALGRHEEAIELWHKVLGFKQHEATAYGNLAAMYFEIGKFEDALRSAKRAFELDPGDQLAILNYSMAEFYIGDLKTVVAVLDTFLNKGDVSHPSLVSPLAAAHLILGEQDRGVDLFKKLMINGYDCARYIRDVSDKLISAGNVERTRLLLNAAVNAHIADQNIISLLERSGKAGSQ